MSGNFVKEKKSQCVCSFNIIIETFDQGQCNNDVLLNVRMVLKLK